MNGASAIAFDDGHAYECFMGGWSRAAGVVFLEWLAPPPRARWLDIGCGTGAFTELVLDRCAPASLIGIDPARAQIAYCLAQPMAKRVDFRIGDAHALPFPDGSFDVVTSALVLNFLTDPGQALAEMCRLGCSGGLVAAYVWDFASELAPNSCVAHGLRRLGITVAPMAGTEISTLQSLKASFRQAGFDDIATTCFDVAMTFGNFDDFWHTQIPPFSPLTKIIAELTRADRTTLIEFARSQLATGPDGTVSCSARANAVRARRPIADRA